MQPTTHKTKTRSCSQRTHDLCPNSARRGMASKILAVFLALLVTVSSAILICSRDSTIEESAAATKNIQPTSSIWSWLSDTPTIRIVNSNYAEFFGGDHGSGCWEVASFQAATWSVEGGQDDLRWTTSDRGSWDDSKSPTST